MMKLILKFIEKIFLKFGFYIGLDMYKTGRKRDIDFLSYKGRDYVRYSSLELVAYEINNKKIEGNCAEVGVYRGEFAIKINEIFPSKRLYLFDTFEGFSKRDLQIEEINKFSNLKQYFTNTSVDIVLKQMKYPKQCIIKKGYFPETAKEIDDKFCFVSLDADLYNPTYEGLCFFYPKLSKGGYIFIHDFNLIEYKGVRKAVEKFCKENKIGYFPLSDNCGSVVILK